MDCSCDWCHLREMCKRSYDRADCTYQYFDNEDCGCRKVDLDKVKLLMGELQKEIEDSDIDDFVHHIKGLRIDLDYHYSDELKNEWIELNKKYKQECRK